MEKITMSSAQTLPHPRLLAGRLGLAFALALALLANLGDKAFVASSANSGIDPLQILDTSAKNNILFLVSNSDTLASTPESSSDVVGGDDPASRLFQVKQAVRDVISNNTGKANFGLASFQPEIAEHAIDGTKGQIGRAHV